MVGLKLAVILRERIFLLAGTAKSRVIRTRGGRFTKGGGTEEKRQDQTRANTPNDMSCRDTFKHVLRTAKCRQLDMTNRKSWREKKQDNYSLSTKRSSING